MTDLHLSSLGTLYQKQLARCFMQQGVKFTVGLTQMTWLLLALWFDIMHISKDTQRDQKTDINIYFHHLLCAYNTCLYCIELITQWYQKFILQRSTISLLFNNHLQQSHICWLDSIGPSPSCETKITDRNHVNEQKTHTHNIQTERWH